MSNKKIIFVIIFLFLISAVYLSWIEKKQADFNLNKNWWSLSFDNPKSSDLSFTIENHSDESNFHWEILADKEKIQEGDIEILKGSTWTLDVQGDMPETNGDNKKATISATNGNDKKNIYKIFP